MKSAVHKMGVIFVVLAFLLSAIMTAQFVAPAKALTPWYDPSWTKRKLVTINSLNPSNLIDYQVKINVGYDSDMKTDFSDLRFTDSDGVTLIPYWIESYTASVSAVVWVKVPSIPASGTTTIYMYYGNPSASGTSDGPATFELFDDFEKEYVSGWTDKKAMPSPKSDATAAVYGGKLYVFGGYYLGAGDPRKETYEYDPGTDTWVQKADMPTARWGPLAVEYNGKIYVFGGTVNVNEVYDPVTDTWSTKNSLPSGFNQGLMGVRYGDKIHLFYKSLHYEYDPVSDTYTPKANVPTWRTWGTCAVVGDKIYVIGGYSYGPGPTGATNVNEVYDPATDTWTTKAPMPIGKYGVTRENPVINGKIYVTHGLNGGFHTDNYVYDPSTNSWEQKSSATHARDGVSCGVINNRLYVVGGRADGLPTGLDYNEEYDPSIDVGTPPPSWILSDPSKVKRDTSAKYEGNYGLMINDDTAAASEYAEHLHSLPTLALDVYWDMTDALGVAPAGAPLQPQGRIMLTGSISDGALYYYEDSGAKFKWYFGGFTLLQSGGWNTWYHITIIWNGAGSKVIINGAEYSVLATTATSDRVRLESSSLEKSKMYFDLVRVRKYSSPEPTIAMGEEQSPLPPPPVGILAKYDINDEFKENDPTIGDEFMTDMYGAIAVSDDIYAVTRVLDSYYYSQQIFRFGVGTGLGEFTVTWEGNIGFQDLPGGPHTEGIDIWNRAINSWESVGTVSQVGDFQTSPGPPAGASVQYKMLFMVQDEVISKTYKTNVNDYISGGYIYVMVWAKNSHDATVCTDYVKLDCKYRNLKADSQSAFPSTVIQGETIHITVTVKNTGTTTETFDVNLKYGSTVLHTWTSVTTGPSAQIVLTWDWATSGVPPGTYSITAVVDPTNAISETDEMDNTCTVPSAVTIKSPPPPPPPVGGVWVPINKFQLLAPWIGLASLITVATASIVYVKHRKKKQN